MSMLIQYIVVAVMVLASAWYALRKLAPLLTNRWLGAVSIYLNRPNRVAWLRAIGRYVQPKQATGNCGDGCSTCNACGVKPPVHAKTDIKPLQFRTRHVQK